MGEQLSVAQRQGLGFGLLLSLMILITLVGINRVGLIDSTLTALSEGATQKQRHAINFRGSVHDRAIAVRDAVLVTDDRSLQKHLGEITRLRLFYAEAAQGMQRALNGTGASEEELRLLDSIQEIERTTMAASQALLDLRQAGEIQAARTLLLAEVTGGYSEWLRRINLFIDHQEAVIAAELALIERVAGGFRMLILTVTAIALVLGAAIAVGFIRHLAGLLGGEPREVADVITRLAAGDLGQTVKQGRPGSVMAALGATLHSLQQTISQVRAATGELSSASVQLRQTAGGNNQQIRIQSREAEQMAAAVEQMAATVTEVAGHADQPPTGAAYR